ncbi:MAG: Ig-like domain repeat protein [Terracidiphilus sp.]
MTGATLSITSGTGTCSVTAAKAADTNYNSATSTAATVTVQLAAQTITFTAASPVTYGVAPIALSATGGGSANPVTFSLVSGPATLSGSSLTVTGIGTIVIDANQAGNSNYSAATQVAQSIAVNQAALTVTANNASRTYGTINPSLSGTYSGEVNGDTFTETESTTAAITSDAGTYAIVPNVTGTNLADYSVAIQNGTLTITQAGTTTTLSTSSGSINPGQSVTLTATVASATTGTPTGSVNFYDGTTLLNTATLSGGTASYITTALPAGSTHQVTAVYSGDINFLTSSTTASIPVVVAPLDFTMTAQGSASQTINAGAAASFQFVVSPLYGSYPASVTFAASGQPGGSTVTFSPSSLAANGGQQTVTMTVQTASTSAMRQAVPQPSAGRRLQPFALALLLLLGIGGMRRHGRNLRRMFLAMILLIGGAATLITGCGGSSGPPPQTSTITVTVSSGNMQHTAIVTLTVQ